jgi:protein SCO1/2
MRPLATLRSLAPALLAVAVLATAAPGQEQPRPDAPTIGSLLDRIGFDQKLDAQLPLGLTFRDEDGRAVALGSYFGKRPVILTLVYYNCPMLCTQTLNGLARGLKPLSLAVGQDFDIVTVSINPNEDPGLAALKKRAYLERYDRDGAERGWHFLTTGDKATIDALAQAVGFRYTYNPESGLYAHAAGLVLATPKGKVSRYFYGMDFPPRDLQFGLIEASAGRVGSPIARALLFCYDYDAASGKYTVAIMRLTQVLGVATVVVLAAAVAALLWRERRRAAAVVAPNPPAAFPPL